MKRTIWMMMLLLALTACGKMGKDGRVKQNVNWSDWYYDDVDGSASKPGLMIMSFNVRYGSASEDTGDKAWTNRREGCYAMINTLQPVLMGVQECQKTQRNDLMANCPDYLSVGRSRDNTDNGEQMAIFYKPDSVAVEDWGTFWLTDTPDQVSKHPMAGHYRCATWAKVRHLKTSTEFYYINTHLDLQGVRGYEVGIILDFISRNCGSLPVVLTADWNDTEDSAIFDDLYNEALFQNARWTASVGDAYGTYNGFTNMNSSTRIDHVFYRGFSACTKFVTVRQKWEGYQFISDHFPVYAILKF